jgi:hypothetical protein
MKKLYKHKPLMPWIKKFNKRIGKTGFKVELTFEGLKRSFSGELKDIESWIKRTLKVLWKCSVPICIEAVG